MIRARAAITMIAHSVTQIANGTRFRCMFGQIKRGEVFYTTQRQRRAHPDCWRGTSFARLPSDARCSERRKPSGGGEGHRTTPSARLRFQFLIC